VDSGDSGQPFILKTPSSKFAKEFNGILKKIEEFVIEKNSN
jgi:MinD-like ATPase involved in chromosome partitioning or flagellar assembly